MLNAVLLVALWLGQFPLDTASHGDFPKFSGQVIDDFVGDVCYAVTTADVNGDKKLDVVAVSERSVVWYENPSWKKRIIVHDATERDNVCIASADIDGDGAVDFALGSGWPNGSGAIQWLSRVSSLDEPWTVHFIGAEPSTHRMHFANVLGTGKMQLVISPLTKSQGHGVRLTAFSIPDNPRLDRWPPTVIDASLNRVHNHWHPRTQRDAQSAWNGTFTASAEGICFIEGDGSDFSNTPISPGAGGATPEECGAGEVKTGILAPSRFYIASIEPMHGNQVVIYTGENWTAAAPRWTRRVIDDSLKRGHALWTADVDNDGLDEVVVGHSDAGSGTIKGPGIYVYDPLDADGKQWEKHVIDEGGIATEDACAADLNGDGWLDIVAGGRATHNVKVYFNGGK